MRTRRKAGQQDELVALRAQLAERAAETATKESQLERYAADLRETFKEERRRSRELRESYMATVRALSNAVEARDSSTGKHAERVAAYGIVLAHEVGLPEASDQVIEFGFLLHDIGKVAIPDAILFKPGPLTDEERTVMKRHPLIGFEILRGIDFLDTAKDVVRSHHERWDGTGYPDGLAGTAIPQAARIFAVADALDALTSARPYRAASTFAAARDIVVAASGTHFDPEAIAALRQISDHRLEQIRAEIS